MWLRNTMQNIGREYAEDSGGDVFALGEAKQTHTDRV